MENKTLNIKPIFDIKPVDKTGRVDLVKIRSVSPEINLRKNKTLEIEREDGNEVPEQLIPHLVFGPVFPEPKSKEELVRELEEELKKESNVKTVLASVGGELAEQARVEHQRPVYNAQRLRERHPRKSVVKPRTSPRSDLFGAQNQILRKGANQDRIPRVLRECPILRGRPVCSAINSPASREVEVWLEKNKCESPQARKDRGKKFWLFSFLFLTLTSGGFFLWRSGFDLKQNLTDKGGQAIGNLEGAKADAEKSDFSSASVRFGLAYENFSEISSSLNLLGNSLASLLAVSGFGELKSAQNLAQAGENISKAGEILTLAVGEFYKTNLVSGMGFNGDRKKSLAGIIAPLRDSLGSAQEKISTAGQLLASVDEGIIPEEQRGLFLDFRAQLPLLEEFVGEAVGYADFLSELTGASGPKKYLLLFQNNSELRPTGGFFGSYALVDFSRGFLRGLTVDDVYNVDGQARKNIIPPLEMQHITPTWGMRDANWFIDFPASARKVMQMYTENDGGPAVDGVITITPTLISRILEVVGPVEMSEYGRSINSENFLAEIQEEVEYGENRKQPKQILADFTPRFLEKLESQGTNQWFAIFQILAEGIEQKHLLAYFKNPKFEQTVLKSGFAGEIKETDGDYLMVTHSNIKGSKTDAVIDNSYSLESKIGGDNTIEHSLKIIRTHNGGGNNLGFYNRTNYDFVRVLAPEGSRIFEIKGNLTPNFKPLVDYGEVVGFVEDSDLADYESRGSEVFPGVRQFDEAGKTVFGFWMVTESGKSREVVLKYRTQVEVLGEYSLLVQKQPGTINDVFDFYFKLPKDKRVVYQYPNLSVSNDVVEFRGDLVKDLMLGLKLK